MLPSANHAAEQLHAILPNAFPSAKSRPQWIERNLPGVKDAKVRRGKELKKKSILT
jgi:hypothetical protein